MIDVYKKTLKADGMLLVCIADLASAALELLCILDSMLEPIVRSYDVALRQSDVAFSICHVKNNS